jgi:hypothetical protein
MDTDVLECLGVAGLVGSGGLTVMRKGGLGGRGMSWGVSETLHFN